MAAFLPEDYLTEVDGAAAETAPKTTTIGPSA